jgi:hypothetical protein
MFGKRKIFLSHILDKEMTHVHNEKMEYKVIHYL